MQRVAGEEREILRNAQNDSFGRRLIALLEGMTDGRTDSNCGLLRSVIDFHRRLLEN